MTQPGTQPSNGGRSLGPLIIGGVVFFLVLALVAAFALTGGGDDETTGSGNDGSTSSGSTSGGNGQTAEVTITGQALSPMPNTVQVTDASNDESVGTVAPTLTGVDFNGETVTIGPGGGPKVVMFLAHWCPHCQRELPVAAQLLADGKVPDDVEVYAVSTAVMPDRGNLPSSWFADESWNEPVLLDDASSSALSAYGGGGFPYVVYLDSEHRVLTRTAGEFGADVLEGLWEALAGK